MQQPTRVRRGCKDKHLDCLQTSMNICKDIHTLLFLSYYQWMTLSSKRIRWLISPIPQIVCSDFLHFPKESNTNQCTEQVPETQHTEQTWNKPHHNTVACDSDPHSLPSHLALLTWLGGGWGGGFWEVFSTISISTAEFCTMERKVS